GKVGGAFTAGGRAGSGAELTLLNVLHILLNHGMIIQGEPFGPHYGPVALGEPTEELFHFCRTWGARWARLVKRLAAGQGALRVELLHRLLGDAESVHSSLMTQPKHLFPHA